MGSGASLCDAAAAPHWRCRGRGGFDSRRATSVEVPRRTRASPPAPPMQRSSQHRPLRDLGGSPDFPGFHRTCGYGVLASHHRLRERVIGSPRARGVEDRFPGRADRADLGDPGSENDQKGHEAKQPRIVEVVNCGQASMFAGGATGTNPPDLPIPRSTALALVTRTREGRTVYQWRGPDDGPIDPAVSIRLLVPAAYPATSRAAIRMSGCGPTRDEARGRVLQCFPASAVTDHQSRDSYLRWRSIARLRLWVTKTRGVMITRDRPGVPAPFTLSTLCRRASGSRVVWS